jgi:hypothetical protein
MPRDGAIIFSDLVGKLDVFNVEWDKCGRRGRYHLYRLIERYGIDAKVTTGRTRSQRTASRTESISARGQHDPHVRIE